MSGTTPPTARWQHPAAVVHLDVRVGDKIRYKGTYGPREGEVIELRDHLLLVRRYTEPFTWGSRSGGVRPILRERVIEVIREKDGIDEPVGREPDDAADAPDVGLRAHPRHKV